MSTRRSSSLCAAALAAFVGLGYGTALAAVTDAELAAMVKEDLDHVIRPGNGTNNWWNVGEKMFMYPPAFGFTGVKADSYKYTLIDDRHAQHVFHAPTPQESLRSIWPEVPVGMCTLVVDAMDAEKKSLGLVGMRTFWKLAAFKPGAYPPAARPYIEAARRYYDFLFKAPHVRYLLEHGVTDPTYENNSYPTKMNAALVQAMIHYAALCPEHADEAMKIAHLAADYLLAASEGPDAPLAGFPPTYETRPELKIQAAKDREGLTMMSYPASAANAYLKLFETTGETKYRDAALAIADTYLRLQGADGTWPLLVFLKDARAQDGTRLQPIGIAMFLDRVATLTGERKYRDAADRAIAWEEAGPMKTFDWSGQFEDAGVLAPYRNLTKHGACDYAIFLVKRFPDDEKRIADARELLRFSENIFVFWERPSRDDGTCVAQYPKSYYGAFHFKNWCVLPGVGEQHWWNVPIDSSAAKLIRTYLALYRVTKNPLDLAKAKALGDSITRAQLGNGDIPTHWTVLHVSAQTLGHTGWMNCGITAATALEELAAAVEEADAEQVQYVRGDTDKDPVGYAVGEEMRFTLAAKGPCAADCSLEWVRAGDDGVTETNRASVAADRPVTYVTKLSRPGFVSIEAKLLGPDGKPVKDAVPFRGGAGAAVESIAPYPEPADFDAFWAERKRRLAAVPMEPELREVKGPYSGLRVWAFSVPCAGPRPATGYLCVPKAASAAHPVPIRMEVSGYGYYRHDPPKTPMKDRITINVNAHGMKLPAFGADEAYYKRLGEEIKSNGHSYAFDPVQNANPDTAYFMGMAYRLMRALAFAKSRPEWNRKDIWVSGGSQGGFQTMLIAGLDPDVTEASPSVPWCCDLGGTELGRLRGNWYVHWTPALGYFDPVYLARRVNPDLYCNIVRAGLGDYVCPPSGIAALYNALPCRKRIVWAQNETHGYVQPSFRRQTYERKAPASPKARQ